MYVLAPARIRSCVCECLSAGRYLKLRFCICGICCDLEGAFINVWAFSRRGMRNVALVKFSAYQKLRGGWCDGVAV